MADLDHFSEITEETMDGEAPAGEEQERAEDGEEKSDMEELTALCERLLIRTMAMQNSLVDLHAEIKENRMEYNRDRKNMWLVLTDLDEARQEFLDEKRKERKLPIRAVFCGASGFPLCSRLSCGTGSLPAYMELLEAPKLWERSEHHSPYRFFPSRAVWR